jgi:signal transduction histidine kinase
MHRAWLIASMAAAGAALGIAAEVVSDAALGPSVVDLVTGWTILGCGLWGWMQWPDERSWSLMVAAGFAWFAGNFAAVDVLRYAHRGPLVHAVVTGSRTRSRLTFAPVVLGYADVFASGVRGATTIAVGVALVVVAPGTKGFALASLLTLAAGFLLAGATATAHLSAGRVDAVTYGYDAALGLSALLLATGAARLQRAHARLADLVVELGPERRSPTIRDALSRALGDPSLEVGYWTPNLGRYVGADGRVVALPEADSGRTATIVERDGERIAALVHDAAVLGDRRHADTVHEAAGLILANARLQETVGAQLAELRASRQRIVEARDEQRRRLARRLHEGAESQLAEVAETIRLARHDSASDATGPGVHELIERELAAAGEELRELARGIHPRVLTERGLRPALAALAERSPVPVTVVAPADRLPVAVEAAAYFVCSEALANVAKYSQAARARCAVLVHDAWVTVTVADDGVGGADPDRGSGLRGLADRVEALGGQLTISSPAGDGTTVTAELPLVVQGTH